MGYTDLVKAHRIKALLLRGELCFSQQDTLTSRPCASFDTLLIWDFVFP